MTECDECGYDLGWGSRWNGAFVVEDNSENEIYGFCDYHCLYGFCLGRTMKPRKIDEEKTKFKFFILTMFHGAKPWETGGMIDYDLKELGKFESLKELFNYVVNTLGVAPKINLMEEKE